MIHLEKIKKNLTTIIFFNICGLNLIFATELQIGSLMPEINYKLNDISGKQITLRQVQGDKGTLVIFSCNTCPWVLKWEERYVSISKKYKGRADSSLSPLSP